MFSIFGSWFVLRLSCICPVLYCFVMFCPAFACFVRFCPVVLFCAVLCWFRPVSSCYILFFPVFFLCFTVLSYIFLFCLLCPSLSFLVRCVRVCSIFFPVCLNSGHVWSRLVNNDNNFKYCTILVKFANHELILQIIQGAFRPFSLVHIFYEHS